MMKKTDIEKSLFVTFEGIDGSGKSTIMRSVAEKLNEFFENTEKVVCTFEPYNKKIRQFIFDNEVSDIKSEVLLFTADRVEHLKKVIIPELKDNKIVLCDRYLDSSIVYQGFSKIRDWKYVYNVNKDSGILLPNTTFLLDVDIMVAEKRMKTDDKRVLNRFDKENTMTKIKMKKSFLELAEKFPKRFIVINGNRNIEEITNDIFEKIIKKYNEM